MTPEKPQDLSASLSSLAMLSLQLKEGKDYLDYLRGFVVYTVGRVGNQPFDAATIQKGVEQEFRLKIPVATFVIYLKRLVKEGAIRPIGAGLQFQVVKLPPTAIDADRSAAQMRIKEVTEELVAFAHHRYSITWDKNTSAAALAEFLRQYSIEFLKFAEAKSPLPEVSSKTNATDYVVAAFVTTCAKERPGVFESIKVLVQSHILANALMCPDLELTAQGFKDVVFLADTKFLLRALDLESPFDTDNAKELLSAIRKLKGIVCVFPETKEELRSVLKAIIKNMQQGGERRGLVYQELLKRGRGVADLILVESNLEDRLKALAISTYPSPRYEATNYPFQIDEGELREEIEEEIDYLKDRAEEHDVRVVRNIFALRKGQRASSIENARFVFLTTNSALSRAAFNYERKNSIGWFFSAVVTDYHLSHLAWLKSPMSAPNLPRAEILANCYATMKPHESFWTQYLAELDRLKREGKVSRRDHEALRLSINAPDELMEVTQGDVQGLNERNVHRILERLEKTYATQKEEALQQERAEHEKTRVALAVAEENAKARAKARRARVDRIANRISRAVFYLTGLAFAGVAVLALCGNLSIWYGIPAAIVGFLNLWTGFSGNTVERAVRRWISAGLSSFFE